MPDIRTLQQVHQGNVHIVSITGDTIHTAKVDTAIVNFEGDPYEGETEVESLLYDSYVLATKNKTMHDNVTVLPITILDVDNPAGGYTVTIGKF